MGINRLFGKGDEELNWNIDEYINLLEEQLYMPISNQLIIDDNSELESLKKQCKCTIGIYKYLRDEYDSKSLKEGLQLIRDEKIKENIIEVWIEEGLPGGRIFDAIFQGYPKYRDKLID